MIELRSWSDAPGGEETWREAGLVQAEQSDKLPHASEARFLNPACQQRCQLAWPLERRHVAAIFQDGEARMRQVLGHAFALREAAQPVLAAGHDQGRAGDAFEIGVAVVADQCGLPCPHLASQPALHGAQALQQPRADEATKATPATRSGAVRVSARETKPPIEKPTSTKRSGEPSSTRRAMPSSVESS